MEILKMYGKTIYNDLDKLDTFLINESIVRMARSAIPYSQAFREFCRENPNLIKLRDTLSRAVLCGDTGEPVRGKKTVFNDLSTFDAMLHEMTLARMKDLAVTYEEAYKVVCRENSGLMDLRQKLLPDNVGWKPK